jgi:hypothetical protein
MPKNNNLLVIEFNSKPLVALDSAPYYYSKKIYYDAYLTKQNKKNNITE